MSIYSKKGNIMNKNLDSCLDLLESYNKGNNISNK